MRLILILCSFFLISTVNAQIYTADLELVLTSVKEYSSINSELIKYNKELLKEKEPIVNKINDLKSSSAYLSSILNENGKESKRKELFLLERELSILEQEQKLKLINKERSLKFPLIRKILGFMKGYFDKTQINFIVDPEAIFFYKKDSTEVIDLTDEIIKAYDKKRD